MIIGSAHTLSPSLTQSLQDFKLQLENERASADENKPARAKADPPAVEEPSPAQTDPARMVQNLNQTSEASQARRDMARKATVQSFKAQHTKDMIETYQNAASNNDEDEEDDIYITTYDPAEVARTSLKYSRRNDLINAFEQAQRQPAESHLNIVV